jgi:oxygen-independent coproporphyrinogen-3 oxidase
VEREFGAEPVARAVEVAEGLAEDGLVETAGGTVRLTARGRMLSNEVFQEFLGLDGEGLEDGERVGRG